MLRSAVAFLIAVLCSGSVVQAQTSASLTRGQVLWTVAGAGGGFSLGAWIGLSKFDDAVNSDRKVWTSAIVGAGLGAVGGYLIGRARRNRNPSSPATTIAPKGRVEAIDQRLLDHLTRSIRLPKRAL